MAQQDTAAAPVTKVSWNSAADPDFTIPSTGDMADSEPAPAAEAAPVEAVADAPAEGDAAVEADAAPAAEAATEEPPAPVVDEKAERNARLDRLAQYDAKLRRDRAAVKAQQTEYESKLSELRQFNEQLAALRSNPVEAAKFLGLDPRELLRATLGEEAPPKSQEEILREEIEQLKAWRAERAQAEREAAEKAKADEQAREQSERLRGIYSAAEQGIKAEADAFELINAKGAYQLVVDTQMAFYRQHKAAIDWRTAAQYVEADLEKEAEAYLGTKKISSRVKPAQPAAAKPQTAAASQAPQAIPGSKTITARPVAVDRTTPERVTMTSRYVDRDESIDAIAAQLAAANRAR